MINKVILLGRVGQDPEAKTTQSDTTITTVSVATSESWKDKNTGDWKSKTEWHRVVAFGQTANIVRDNFRKGDLVYIEGAIQTREWETQEGEKKRVTEIVLKPYGSKVKKLTPKSEGNSGGGYQQPQNNNQGSASASLDDEIPF